MGEREIDTEFRQLDEEVVLVSTWVRLDSSYPSLSEVTYRGKHDESVDKSLYWGTPQDEY